MVISAIKIQSKNKQRVNVYVEGTYKFSLDIFQVGELGLKVGREYSNAELLALQSESEFGKAYGRAIELISRRPRSVKELYDYAFRKKWDRDLTDRVVQRLLERKHLNDKSFTRFWIAARAAGKPMSKRALQVELRRKGIASDVIEATLIGEDESGYDELSALKQIISKRRHRYDDERKFIAYLARQGFGFSDIISALKKDEA